MTDTLEPVEAIVKQQAAMAPNELSPMAMISSIVQQGADPAALERVTAWAERMQANEARRAYAQAITNFKAICPTVNRTAKGHTNTYARLVDIDEQIRPALTQCQLSPSWRVVKNDKEWIEVECRVTHVMSHYESTSLGGPPDRGPGRNELQARASTVSYLERYTLKALLGIVDKDMLDNDGADGGPSEEQKPPLPPSADREAEAKRQFRDLCQRKAGAKFVKDQLLAILAGVRAASGKEAVAECSAWLDDEAILLAEDGTLSIVTDTPADDPFAEPQTSAAAEPKGLQGGADPASSYPPPLSELSIGEMLSWPNACDECGTRYKVMTAGGKCKARGCLGQVVPVKV